MVNRIFGVIVALLLVLASFGVIAGNPQINAITFESFLSTLENAPRIPTDWIGALQTSFVSSFPSYLKWLGSIIDTITSIIQVPLYASTAILNFIPFIIYFTNFAFGAL